MKLVDNRGEQDVLEALLEGASPPGRTTAGLDYLLAPPSLSPEQGGSRFRAVTDPGVFGANRSGTAGAELGYWLEVSPRRRRSQAPSNRWRTPPSGRPAAQAVDLRPAAAADGAIWQHPRITGQPGSWRGLPRRPGSAPSSINQFRDPWPSWCNALLTPGFPLRPGPYAERQTWYLAVSPDRSNAAAALANPCSLPRWHGGGGSDASRRQGHRGFLTRGQRPFAADL